MMTIVGFLAALLTLTVTSFLGVAHAAGSKADVIAMVEAQLATCAYAETAYETLQGAPATVRGLKVIDYLSADSGEGSVWGFVIAADPAMVAAVMPEALQEKIMIDPELGGPVTSGIREHDAPGQTLVFCQWINPNPED